MKLLEYFKELSLYPKNTEELKGLILQLAVQGKLTVNWRNENPGIKDACTSSKKLDIIVWSFSINWENFQILVYR